MKTYYEPGKKLLWKKKEVVEIVEASFLQNQPENFLNYLIKREGKEGLFAAYPDDLEEIVFKVIIAGTRTFNNFDLLAQVCDKALVRQKNIEIVSGGAEGADKLGENYAYLRGYKLKLFKADWKTHGKAAGPIRNEEMAKYAQALIAFWDGFSPGTANMIKLAEQYNLKVKVARY